MPDKIYTEEDMLAHKAEAVRYERDQSSKIAASAVMKFRRNADGKYYPGYHEDMRDFVRREVIKDR